MMKRMLPFVFFTVAAVAQQPTPPAKAAKVCVAQLRNESGTSFQVGKLRESYVANLAATKLAKDGAIIVVPIEVTSADNASAELQKNSCDYAVYTRILRKAKGEAFRTLETGTTYEISRRDEPDPETYGLQCTVEKTSSGMPVLIDRQYDTRATKDDKGVLKLLTLQSGRIEQALGKKLRQ
jgi:hypothetical protein